VYSDNETSTDLLGFEDQVSDLCEIVLDPGLLPVTVGVLGDWGSGKSSLLWMVENELRDRDAVVVYFSPWRVEDYDDAKSALLDTVVEEVSAYIPDDDEHAEVRESLRNKLRGLRRRVRWLRAAGLAAKSIVTMSAPSLDDMDKLLRDEDEDDDAPSTARITRDFHEEFKLLVEELDRPVVVLVDDLDRCQPEQVLDVLHAIRLFLSVPGTAFVIATDERPRRYRCSAWLRSPQDVR
jgi:predicted KAP-like P-loop ATPase